MTGNATNLVSDSLSAERMPSPAASVEGQWTWYDHAKKPFADTAGESRLASLVGRMLPNQTGLLTNWLVRFERNDRGRVTERAETWTQLDGKLTARTNTYIYNGNHIDLNCNNEPEGNLKALYDYDANGFHQITEAANI